jgi:hypothetical protein
MITPRGTGTLRPSTSPIQPTTENRVSQFTTYNYDMRYDICQSAEVHKYIFWPSNSVWHTFSHAYIILPPIAHKCNHVTHGSALMDM